MFPAENIDNGYIWYTFIPSVNMILLYIVKSIYNNTLIEADLQLISMDDNIIVDKFYKENKILIDKVNSHVISRLI